jgi:uncharacterized protein YgfB (UPF0149 family)
MVSCGCHCLLGKVGLAYECHDLHTDLVGGEIAAAKEVCWVDRLLDVLVGEAAAGKNWYHHHNTVLAMQEGTDSRMKAEEVAHNIAVADKDSEMVAETQEEVVGTLSHLGRSPAKEYDGEKVLQMLGAGTLVAEKQLGT